MSAGLNQLSMPLDKHHVSWPKSIIHASR